MQALHSVTLRRGIPFMKSSPRRPFSTSPSPRLTFVGAIDGSKVSIEALDRMARLMQKDDKGYLLTVIEPVETFFAPSIPSQQIKDMNSYKRHRVNKLQDDLKDKVRSLHKNFEWVVREGEPAEEINKFAFEKKADFLIMGDGGWSKIRKMLLGSVCSTVVHQAPCSVIVVKDSERVRRDWRKSHED